MILGVCLGVVLAERLYGLFLSSFLNRAVLDLPRLLGYIVALCLAEALQVLLLWAVMLLIARLIGIRDRTLRISYVVAACIAVVAMKMFAYNVLSYLGDFVRARVVTKISDGAGGAVPYVLGYLDGQLPVIGLVALCSLIGAIVVKRIGRRLPDRELPRLFPSCLATVAMAGLIFLIQAILAWSPHDALAVQLRRVPVFALADQILARASDFDGDGVGWLASPRDFAPWDASRHPFAIEIPGNGIDENGYGGDLPAEVSYSTPPTNSPVTLRPDVLLVIECTFRYGLVELDVDGKPVMPFLRSLGEKGYAGKAYSHQGSTIPGVCGILTGDPVYFHESLIRDFKQRGYHTIVSLANNEEFGKIGKRSGLRDADQLFHAGMASEDRITISSAASSMSLSADRVIAEFSDMLARAPSDMPIFAVVFMESLHYPYSLDSPEKIFECQDVPIAGLTKQNREAIVRMYNNAAANLDRRIEKLYGLWAEQRQQQGTPVFAMVGDHGESFFEDDSFGHGLELTEAQTATPIVMSGGWGQVPEPIGQSDIRNLLLNLLSDPSPVPGRYEIIERARPIFQIIGELDQPLQIAWVGRGGRDLVDFTSGNFIDSKGLVTRLDRLQADSPGLRLIHEWESRRIGIMRQKNAIGP